MTSPTFKTLRAQNLPIGQVVVAQVWMTNTHRVQKLVRIEAVKGKTVTTGIEVVTNEFVAKTIPGTCWMGTEVEGKTRRVTFGLPKGMTTTQLLLPAPAKAEVPVKAKRVRKPLTREQKNRKNEMARLRRAKAKAK